MCYVWHKAFGKNWILIGFNNRAQFLHQPFIYRVYNHIVWLALYLFATTMHLIKTKQPLQWCFVRLLLKYWHHQPKTLEMSQPEWTYRNNNWSHVFKYSHWINTYWSNDAFAMHKQFFPKFFELKLHNGVNSILKHSGQ